MCFEEKLDQWKEQNCFYIFTRFKLEDNLMKMHADLTDIYEESCVSNCIICRWVLHSKCVEIDTKDEHMSCHRVTVWNEQTLLWVCKVTEKNPFISTSNLCSLFDISRGRAGVLHDNLNLQKIFLKWVSHQLIEDQKKQSFASSKKKQQQKITRNLVAQNDYALLP